jgi:hypothetical protein
MKKKKKVKVRSPFSKSPVQKFLSEDAEEPTVREISSFNEKRLSERLGFDLTPGSGCVPCLRKKGDGRTEDFVIECKETKSSSIRITSEMLGKVYAEAKYSGKEPVMVISIYGVPDPVPRDWVMVPAYLFDST